MKTAGYVSDVLTDAAIAFVRASREQPFFTLLALNAPHTPRQDRGARGLAEFVRRFRVHNIADQDGIADWMRADVPHPQQGAVRTRHPRRGVSRQSDRRRSLTSLNWVETHVRSTGPLSALYPTRTWTAPNPHGCLKEGDTPSRFFFLPRGGNDPTDHSAPGWGGQFRREPDGWWRDLPAREGFDPRTAVSRWRPDFQRDFARRMRWSRPRRDAGRDYRLAPGFGRTTPPAPWFIGNSRAERSTSSSQRASRARRSATCAGSR